MRSASLIQLHQRAVAILDLIQRAEDRLSYYTERIHQARHYWHDERRANRIEQERDTTRNAIVRLTLAYTNTLDRLNAVVVKSLKPKS